MKVADSKFFQAPKRHLRKIFLLQSAFSEYSQSTREVGEQHRPIAFHKARAEHRNRRRWSPFVQRTTWQSDRTIQFQERCDFETCALNDNTIAVIFIRQRYYKSLRKIPIKRDRRKETRLVALWFHHTCVLELRFRILAIIRNNTLDMRFVSCNLMQALKIVKVSEQFRPKKIEEKRPFSLWARAVITGHMCTRTRITFINWTPRSVSNFRDHSRFPTCPEHNLHEIPGWA